VCVCVGECRYGFCNVCGCVFVDFVMCVCVCVYVGVGVFVCVFCNV